MLVFYSCCYNYENLSVLRKHWFIIAEFSRSEVGFLVWGRSWEAVMEVFGQPELLSWYPGGESVSEFIQFVGRIDCLEIEGLVPLFPGWLLARVCSLLLEASLAFGLLLPYPKPVSDTGRPWGLLMKYLNLWPALSCLSSFFHSSPFL